MYLFHPGAQTVNAAISLRARATVETRSDSRIVIRSEDTGATVEADDWRELRDRRELRLLSLLVHFFEARGLTLTTSSESPAGAGIAGSSALNVAVCAALAQWNRTHYEPEALLQVAMNVEAQAINVPTGLQDYRPALYGGIAALELEVDGVRRVALDVDPLELERRLVLCYTGEPRNSGTNNWDIFKRHIDGDQRIFDCFEHIRDTAAAMRRALTEADWDGVGRAIAEEWEHRQASRAWRVDTSHRRPDRTGHGCRRHSGESLRRRRRRMPGELRTAGPPCRDSDRAAGRGRQDPPFHHRTPRSHPWIGAGRGVADNSGFVPLKSLAKGPPDPAAALAEIRRIYFKTTKRTIEHDIAHAIELLKSLPSEDEREKATVYMEGLAQMRREWARKKTP